MSEQPEALRLAEMPFSLRDGRWNFDADDELRRLHALCNEMGEALQACIGPATHCYHTNNDPDGSLWSAVIKARAAIAKWKESK